MGITSITVQQEFRVVERPGPYGLFAGSYRLLLLDRMETQAQLLQSRNLLLV